MRNAVHEHRVAVVLEVATADVRLGVRQAPGPQLQLGRGLCRKVAAAVIVEVARPLLAELRLVRQVLLLLEWSPARLEPSLLLQEEGRLRGVDAGLWLEGLHRCSACRGEGQAGREARGRR